MATLSPITNINSGSNLSTGGQKIMGKDDFLQLLVTKLQYQDPLNPMDDEDFIAQLAQFSTLEQMNNIASGISQSNQFDFLQMQSLNNTMAAGLIGKDVKAEYNGIYLDQGEATKISFTLDESVVELNLEIRDSGGNIVATISKEALSFGVNSVMWDGRDRLGNTVPDGYYTVAASGKNAAGKTVTPLMSLVGKVESISYREGIAYLKVAGVEISLGDVVAIGELGAFTDSNESGDEEG